MSISRPAERGQLDAEYPDRTPGRNAAQARSGAAAWLSRQDEPDPHGEVAAAVSGKRTSTGHHRCFPARDQR
jgi:hypothetical protein